jgi:hypothetical protein
LASLAWLAGPWVAQGCPFLMGPQAPPCTRSPWQSVLDHLLPGRRFFRKMSKRAGKFQGPRNRLSELSEGMNGYGAIGDLR